MRTGALTRECNGNGSCWESLVNHAIHGLPLPLKIPQRIINFEEVKVKGMAPTNIMTS